MNQNTLFAQLANIVGHDHIHFDEKSKSFYGQDMTRQFTPNPVAIVFPKNEEQVISLVKLANMTKTSLVPSGGRTGYSGGAVAVAGEIVVALDKFNRILNIDHANKQIRCEPGVTTKAIQNAAIDSGLYYPVDFASSGSSQIGGNVATNAGGIKVIRYGLTRNWVAGLKVVTGNGDLLISNSGLIKNASGYDLKQLFIGSEGTLGIITEVTLHLTTPPKDPRVLLLAVNSEKHFTNILKQFSAYLEVLAFEFFSERALSYVTSDGKLSHPFMSATPFYILLEYESNELSDEICGKITKRFMMQKVVSDAVISNSHSQEKTFWQYREKISMSIIDYNPRKYDLSILPSNISNVINEIDSFLAKMSPEAEIIWFGHLGDGNLHLNVILPRMDEEKKHDKYTLLDNIIFEVIKKYRGSISAEHGVGLLKKSFLPFAKDDSEIKYMQSIKNLFDQNNIMNPGKIF